MSWSELDNFSAISWILFTQALLLQNLKCFVISNTVRYLDRCQRDCFCGRGAYNGLQNQAFVWVPAEVWIAEWLPCQLISPCHCFSGEGWELIFPFQFLTSDASWLKTKIYLFFGYPFLSLLQCQKRLCLSKQTARDCKYSLSSKYFLRLNFYMIFCSDFCLLKINLETMLGRR